MSVSDQTSSTLMHCVIPHDHPSLAGHFPGKPIVPGVVMLNEVMAALGSWRPDFVLGAVPAVKFLRPLQPGESFSIRLEAAANGFRFECFSAEHVLAKGSLKERQAQGGGT